MSHPDFLEYVRSGEAKRVLLLHHWDTDGLACASLFLRKAEEEAWPVDAIELEYPTINNYFLTEEEFERIAAGNYDVIACMDINFPVDVIERLEQITTTYVFDHHAQTANIDRPGRQDISYPGCTLVVNEYLGYEPSLTGVLGAVGDQELRIQKNEQWWPQIEQVLNDAGYTVEQVLRMTKLIDTSYIIGGRDDLMHAIKVISSGPENALTDEQFLKNDEYIKTEFDRESSKEMEEVSELVRYQTVESDLSLISEVTRAKARAMTDKVIVTQQVWSTEPGGMSSFYVRRAEVDIDLGVIVDMAREQGFNAGGKAEVAGVVLPTDQLDAFREQTFAKLAEVLG